MKKIYVITCLLVLSYTAFGQNMNISSQPSFDGGQGNEKLNAYIYSQLRTPEPDTIIGKFVIAVQFSIDVDGSVVDVEIRRTGGGSGSTPQPILETEVLRVFNSMPKELWTPSIHNRTGKPVKFGPIITPVFYDRQPN